MGLLAGEEAEGEGEEEGEEEEKEEREERKKEERRRKEKKERKNNEKRKKKEREEKEGLFAGKRASSLILKPLTLWVELVLFTLLPLVLLHTLGDLVPLRGSNTLALVL